VGEQFGERERWKNSLGLIKFIGELFKLQMLTERIMHECVKKLLWNVDNPEEEEIESLCKLLTTVGRILDTAKARAHMVVYFSRMKELTSSAKSTFVFPNMELTDRYLNLLSAEPQVPLRLQQTVWTIMLPQFLRQRVVKGRKANASRGRKPGPKKKAIDRG
jgi:hypothetical protein